MYSSRRSLRSSGPVPRRSDHQNPPRLRRSRPSPRDPGDTGPAPRQHLRTPAPGTHPRSPHRRRVDPAAGLIRSSPTGHTAPAVSVPIYENTASRTPSRRRPTSDGTGRIGADAAGAHRRSTGRPTADATSSNAASTNSRASAPSRPGTRRPRPPTKRSHSRHSHSGQDLFEDGLSLLLRLGPTGR